MDAAPRSLWASLHDGRVERAQIEDGVASLRVDVPHVRHHAGLPREARFTIRASGAAALSVTRFHPPDAPRPPGGDTAAAAAWSALGTMRSMDWDAFARSLLEPLVRFDIEEPERVRVGDRVALVLRGGHRHPVDGYAWVELRVEARSIVLAHEGGREIAESELEALGEAYWAAWRARNAE